MKSQRFLGLICVFAWAIVAASWAQEPSCFNATVQVHQAQGDLVAVGTRVDPHLEGTIPTESADFGALLAREYGNKVFEVDCVPFLWEPLSDGTFRYWAYPTDDTGYGWNEEHPIVLTTRREITPVGDPPLIVVVARLSSVNKATLKRQSTGEAREYTVPVFEVIAAEEGGQSPD